MNLEALSRQIQADSVKESEFIKFEQDLIGYSRQMWSYFGHAGSLHPWHDSDPLSKLRFKGVRPLIVKFFNWLNAKDISLEAYCVFSMSVRDAKDWLTPGSLFSVGKRGVKDWIVKLRRHAESSDNLDLAASVLFRFFELQIENSGAAEVNKKKVIQHDLRYQNSKKNGKAKCMEMYHQLIDRVLPLQNLDVDPVLWLENKFERCLSYQNSKKIPLAMVLNKNGLEPDLEDLRTYSSDPWREIRAFLGLSHTCEFSDGYIPKGWGASGDDRDNLSSVVKITGLGYYFYPNGTQRRGRRHYANNSYFVIKCTPDNFHLFKESWNDPRLISTAPTWEEYSMWGAFPGWWDENGESTNGRGRSVKWRKDGCKKG